MQKFQISVRGLVEFVYRSGDLDMRFQGKSKMAEGMKIHQKIQKSQGSDYQAEVPLSKSIFLEDEGIELFINGRADGILFTEKGYVIDEIKSTSQFVEDITADTYPVHWAQAKLYGAFFCEQNNLETIEIQLTYAQFDSGDINRVKVMYTYEALQTFLEETVTRYKKWLVFKNNWIQKRNDSLEKLTFPFDRYRKGQRQMAVSVYNTIKEGGILYAEAPTGIGKTMSTLFPSLKAMHQGFIDRIFYLSAKTITKVVAEDAIDRLRNQEIDLKHITLTAKDKICLNDQVTCYPEKCKYAKGYFDRSLDALWDIVTHEDGLTKNIILLYAEKYQVCPYEFSLDCALFSDLIICDYNYAFDPRVYLRRFFEFPTENYAFLVDEAHNLVDRARTMYSAEIKKDKFYNAKKQLGKVEKSDKAVSKALEGINKMFLEVRKRCDEKGIFVHQDEVSDVYEQLKKRAPVIEKWLTENHLSDAFDQILDLYFDILGYMRISELYDGGYVFYIINGNDTDTLIKLYSINPSLQLKRFLDNSRATIFFSATISPLKYYTTLLTGDVESKSLMLPSPFDVQNRKVIFASDVSVKYKDRDDAIPKLVHYIYSMVKAKRGNYLVFFPSYAYMQQIYTLFKAMFPDEYDTIIQTRELTEDGKAEFLNAFEKNIDRNGTYAFERSMIGFAVLGGHFSEGIDLKGDLLIGVMVIGVGLPMIGFENDLIKNYFDYEMDGGFEFAYQYPGANKIMQSAGRVIRSEEDKGVILLVDQRYKTKYYRSVLPDDWGSCYTSQATIKSELEKFWEEST